MSDGNAMTDHEFDDEFHTYMLVVAHPDDSEFSSAGTVARLKDAGKRVVLIQVTSGDKGSPERDIDPAELARRREAEELEAAHRLGMDDVVFLRPGHPPMRKREFAEGAKAQASGKAPKFEGTSDIQEVVVSGDWAFMWSRLEVVAHPPDGSVPTKRRGNTLTVFRKEKGRWLLARDANLLS